MEQLNILDNILSKSKDYEVALLTTYNFEIPFFERNILTRLENNNIRMFGLFVDSKNYLDTINSVKSSYVGKKYIVREVDINTSFHPKIILLLGKNKARLIITSANITFSGYCYNNEIFNVFDYDENNSEYLSLIKSAYLYFLNLDSKYSKFDDGVFSKTKEYIYLYKTSKNSLVSFISNYNESILNQINNLNLNIKQIDIAVPFYDNDLNALKKIIELYENATVNLYIQNRFSTFNFNLNDKEKIISKDNLYVFDGFKEIGTNSIYHGKVFRFITDNESYILYGSANCTESALMKSSIDGGNYECDVLVKGTISEFDYFFDNFKLIESNIECSNRNIIYNNYKIYNFRHILSDDIDKIHIKYKNKWNDLKIFINDELCNYEYINGEIVIKLDDTLYNLFSIDFVSDNKKESINAFIIQKNIMEEYRNNTNKDFSLTIDKINNSNSIEYIKYYKMLLNLVSYDINSLKEEKENISLYNETKDRIEEEFDSEFIVDFDIPEEVLNKYYKYNKIESIKRSVITNFITRILSNRKNGMHGRRVFNSEKNIQYNTPLPEEIKFPRYIKRLFNSITDIRYLNECNIKKYIENILLLVNVIYTYNKDNNSNTFKLSEFNQLLLNFLTIIKDKNFISLDENIIYVLKVLLFSVILSVQMDKESIDVKIDINCKNIMLDYDRKFNIKDNYDDILLSALDLIDSSISFENAKLIIEKNLNYKNEEDLYKLINSKLDGNVYIEKNNNVLLIKFETNNISKYMSISNINVIFNEIKNRYKQTKEIDKLILNIINNNLDLKFPNPIINIRYIFDINSLKVLKQFKNKKDTNYRNISLERI